MKQCSTYNVYGEILYAKVSRDVEDMKTMKNFCVLNLFTCIT